MKASELIAQDGIKMTILSGPEYVDDGKWPHNAYRVRLTRVVNGKRRQITAPFMMGMGLQGDPDINDVLHCLCMDASTIENAGGYLDWCDEFGYDAEDVSYRKVYQACKSTFNRLYEFGRGNFTDYLDCEE